MKATTQRPVMRSTTVLNSAGIVSWNRWRMFVTAGAFPVRASVLSAGVMTSCMSVTTTLPYETSTPRSGRVPGRRLDAASQVSGLDANQGAGQGRVELTASELIRVRHRATSLWRSRQSPTPGSRSDRDARGRYRGHSPPTDRRTLELGHGR